MLQIKRLAGTYERYADEWVDATAALDRSLVECSDLHRFIKSQRFHPQSTGQDIHSLLIMPIQRIPRYQLLMQALLPISGPLRSVATDFLNQSQACAHGVNEKRRESEQIHDLRRLALHFAPNQDMKMVAQWVEYSRLTIFRKLSNWGAASLRRVSW